MPVPPEPTPCRAARSWASAHRDGEVTHDDRHAAHLVACSDCAGWERALAQLTPPPRLRVVGAGPDVVGAGLVTAARHGHARQVARVAVVGRGILATAGVAALLLAALCLATGHFLHRGGLATGTELVLFQIAVGVGFVLTARSPDRYLHLLLPLTVALAAVSGLAGTLTLSAGQIDPLRDLSVLPPLLALAGLVLLVGRPARSRHPLATLRAP